MMALTFILKEKRKLSILKPPALIAVALVILLGSNVFASPYEKFVGKLTDTMSLNEKENDEYRNSLHFQRGRYQMRTLGLEGAQILDSITGQIRMCVITTEYDNSVSKKRFIFDCHPWSEDDRSDNDK